jgi:hypothetical protein
VTGALISIAALLLVAATGCLVALSLGIARRGELAVAAYVVAFAEVVGLALFLSAFDLFTRGSLFGGLGLVFIGALAAWWLRGAPRPRSHSEHARPPTVVLTLAAVAALAVAYVFALVVGTPPNGWDPLNYHLARAAFWIQSHHIGYIPNTYDERLNFNPPNAEIAIASAFGLTKSERAAGFVQLFALLACGAGVFALARRFGRSAAEASFGALLFLLTPIVLLQSSGSKNDIVVASFLVAAAVFAVGRTRNELVLLGLASALAVGAKFTAAYGLVVLLALALLARPPSSRWWRCLAIAVGALAGSYWYGVNLHNTGQFLGDQSGTGTLTAPFQPKPNLVTLYGDSVDLLDLSGAQGKDILLFVVAAIVVAGGLALRRTRLSAAIAAGSVVAAVLLIHPLSDAGRSGLLRLYDALGNPPGYLAEGDPATASPTIASDTASWFGPIGLPLIASMAVVTTVLFRRRSSTSAELVAAYAPVAWLLLVAVTLTYHPWQGRFFIFPLALSAVLWGVAVRARPLAWSLAAVASVTALLSLVHYAEKPSGARLLGSTNARSVWRMPRSDVQSTHDAALVPVWRYLDEQVPDAASLALALGPNDFGFPAFGPHLSRHVVLVPSGSSARETRADWLYANAQRSSEIDATCWVPRLTSERGTVFERARECG